MTSSSPRVSLVITTYNRCDKLIPAVESALHQTFTDFEICVIDDGSSDNTAQAIAPYLSGRVRYAAQKNSGVSAARNHGIRISRGELIAFLDDDDLCLPERFQRQVELFDAHPEVDVSFTDLWKIEVATGERYRFTDRVERFWAMYREAGQPRHFILDSGSMWRSLLFEFPLKPSTLMIRRRCFERGGMFDESLCPNEGLDLILRFNRMGVTYGYVHEPTIEYFVWGRNIGLGSGLAAPRGCLRLLEDNLRLAQLTGEQQRWAKQGQAIQHQKIGDSLLRDGQRSAASSSYRRAFLCGYEPAQLARACYAWIRPLTQPGVGRQTRRTGSTSTCESRE